MTVGTTKKCCQRPLFCTNLLVRHFICRIDMFRDNSGEGQMRWMPAVLTSGLILYIMAATDESA